MFGRETLLIMYDLINAYNNCLVLWLVATVTARRDCSGFDLSKAPEKRTRVETPTDGILFPLMSQCCVGLCRLYGYLE